MDDDDPKSSDDWIKIYNRHFLDIRASYGGGASNEAKVSHSLAVVEAALKALLWQKERWNTYPKNRGEYRYLYHHDLEEMAKKAGVLDDLLADKELRASWNTIINANKRKFRYKVTGPSDKEANDVVRSTRAIDTGIGPWLLRRYHGKI